MRSLVVLFIVAVVVAGLYYAWPRFEGESPVVTAPERIALGAAGAEVEIGFADAGTGLRSVSAVLRVGAPASADTAANPSADTPDQAAGEAGGDAAKEIPLHAQTWSGSTLDGPLIAVHEEVARVALDPRAMGLPEGASTLVLRARDWSWSGLGDGNTTEVVVPVVVDTRPPRLSIETGLTYVRRGGAAVVRYRVDADAERSGVRVGEAWFPGFAESTDGRVAVFAIPVDAAPDPRIEVVAIDAVGNESTARFDARLQERTIPEITIPLFDGFLERVAVPLGQAAGLSESTPLATFQRVNSELRARNEATIADAIGAPTAPQWDAVFEQMRNSKVTSEFAEIRHYVVGGERVSRARHYGFDLASTAHAPITASNGGTVIFAGDNGIYGTLVMIDHGLGVTTLYGHLSSLAVAVGDRVEKGQTLGRSGATGLAGGDHLHFAVLVGRTYVDPVEWWDAKWLEEHVTERLR